MDHSNSRLAAKTLDTNSRNYGSSPNNNYYIKRRLFKLNRLRVSLVLVRFLDAF